MVVYLLDITHTINTKLERSMPFFFFFPVPVSSHVINLLSSARNPMKQMFHETGTVHGKWSKPCFNALYEWFYFVFLRVHEYFIFFGLYAENDKHTNGNC